MHLVVRFIQCAGRRCQAGTTNTATYDPTFAPAPLYVSLCGGLLTKSISVISLRFTGPPVPITARVHSTPQRE
eukprot:1942447-Pyramimonas_sp.AAC.1